MKVLHVNEYFDEKSTIPKSWILDYDLILLQNYSPKLTLALDSQNRRLKTLFALNPELAQFDLKNCLAIFGKTISENFIQRLNPDYEITFTEAEKINSLEYASYIKENILPLSLVGYTYFHDFYFHALGVHNIPKSFTKWWNEHKTLLPDVDLVLMASIVEWTTLKEVSPMIVHMFTPEKWTQLDLFFSDQDREIFNSKTISKVYKKPEYPMNKFIQDWART